MEIARSSSCVPRRRCNNILLAKLLQSLNPQQREVITLRYDLIDQNPLTLVKVGEHLNVSRE
ncbi:sigma factor-like helix-turn-helix DNA-binding protein [Acaryochloris marina]|uniref:sigma factor-like helix-turn-helix DNA-binding protein n=1 Tax=Acaryochloris marina TaxID=155978 RepID=UPI0020180DB4|nr:sigma factor-like helix-turn-helix DNA-binding protein [Acaryochloris marina]